MFSDGSVGIARLQLDPETVCRICKSAIDRANVFGEQCMKSETEAARLRSYLRTVSCDGVEALWYSEMERNQETAKG